MATRLNAQEERLATLRSAMNVIAILDQSTPERARPNHGFDLRPLLPVVEFEDADESWERFPPSAEQDSEARSKGVR